MMTFDLKTHFSEAVTINIRLWRRRLLTEAKLADRWWMQKDVVWQAVADGLVFSSTQIEAVSLAVDLLPVLERWGGWFDWLPLLEVATDLDMPPELRCRLLLAQGYICYLNRNIADSIDLLQAGLTLADERQMEELVALAHFHLTNANLRGKAYAQAQKHGTKALRLLSSTPSTALASLYNALGLIDLETGAFATSEDKFHKALTLWSQLDEPTPLARAYLNMGVVYQRQSRWTEAKKCYKQAHKALENTVSVVDKLKVLNGLGTLHYMAEEFSAAEEIFREGFAEARQLQAAFHLRGSLTHNLGNTLLAMGRWGEAKLYLEKSIIYWQQANDDVEQANSLGTLAELYEKQQAWTTAISYYDEAIRLALNYPKNQWGQKLATRFRQAIVNCAAQAAKTSRNI